MSGVTIAVSEATLAWLQELAHPRGTSVSEVLDEAVKQPYDHQFRDPTNAGYTALRADPEAWREVQAERELWDATLMDGLDPQERWPHEGDAGGPLIPGAPRVRGINSAARRGLARRPQPDGRARTGRTPACADRLGRSLQPRTVRLGCGLADHVAHPSSAVACPGSSPRGRLAPEQGNPVRR